MVLCFPDRYLLRNSNENTFNQGAEGSWDLLEAMLRAAMGPREPRFGFGHLRHQIPQGDAKLERSTSNCRSSGCSWSCQGISLLWKATLMKRIAAVWDIVPGKVHMVPLLYLEHRLVRVATYIIFSLTAIAASAKAPIGRSPSPGSAVGILAWIPREVK